MNSFDSGNQRTGQPRCAQLTANTCIWLAPRWRTQHATFEVLPSHGTVNGFWYVASRVWPAGKSLIGPSLTHAWYERLRIADAMYPTTGTAISVAATTFSAMPIFIR